MAAGFGLLRLSPRTLWSMTPREFAAAIGCFKAPDVRPTRCDLTALMQKFPDAEQQEA